MLFDEIEQCRDPGAGREDVLSLLVGVRVEQGLPLSHEELRDQLMLLLIAGHETTSNSLCWTIHQLAQRPAMVAEVRREQAERFPDGFDPTRARELPYLGAVIQESMRLAPIAVGVARRLKRDLELDGHALKAGTILIPSNYLAQRDPRRWERPLEFDPTRFLDKKVDMAAHFPFGLGIWRCLGAAFADYEMRVVLSLLINRYDVELAKDERAQPFLKGITIAPKSGLRVRLVERSRSARLRAQRSRSWT
jgi:cytochrome P450